MRGNTSITLFVVAAVGLASLSAASARRYGHSSTDVANEALGACSVGAGDFRLTEGPWARAMVVKAGSACGGTFGAGGRVAFKRLYLITRPQHGNVTLREGGHYQYLSPSTYRGPDSFMLRVCGSANGHDGCANLQYDVTVQ